MLSNWPEHNGWLTNHLLQLQLDQLLLEESAKVDKTVFKCCLSSDLWNWSIVLERVHTFKERKQPPSILLPSHVKSILNYDVERSQFSLVS